MFVQKIAQYVKNLQNGALQQQEIKKKEKRGK